MTMPASACPNPVAPRPGHDAEVELSVVLPCLNEARTVGHCIDQALEAFRRLGVAGEVVVADNDSTDGSADLARAQGARVVRVARQGYGSALQGGIAAACGRYVILGDADASYDLSQLEAFLERLRAGDDLVVGNRFQGGIRPGAMPWLHRYLGNPLLTGLLNLFFHSPVGDAHCGLRGFRKDAYHRLGLVTAGMEFASEMIVKAVLQQQKISEVSTILSPDGRGRPPHLHSLRDGWRHLRLLLLLCPCWLYLLPALVLLGLGLAGVAWGIAGPQRVGGAVFDLPCLWLGCLGLVLGYQTLWLWALAGLYSWSLGLGPGNGPCIGWLRHLTLERGLVVGAVAVLAGLSVGGGLVLSGWDGAAGPLEGHATMRSALAASTLMLCGMQTVYGSFFLALLRLTKSAAP